MNCYLSVKLEPLRDDRKIIKWYANCEKIEGKHGPNKVTSPEWTLLVHSAGPKPRKRGRVGSHTFVKQHTHKTHRETQHIDTSQGTRISSSFSEADPGIDCLGGSHE
nr:unnamed protein product [Callosobruchus chinensis]CAH7727643.1 unnamed protein product [Callosobruchus chinensis]